MANERVNRRETRVCKGVARRGAGGKGKEIYEFAVTATASAFSPTFFRVRTKQRGKRERRETSEAGETRLIFPKIDVALADRMFIPQRIMGHCFLSVSATSVGFRFRHLRVEYRFD